MARRLEHYLHRQRQPCLANYLVAVVEDQDMPRPRQETPIGPCILKAYTHIHPHLQSTYICMPRLTLALDFVRGHENLPSSLLLHSNTALQLPIEVR